MKGAKGFSLPELLITITLGSIVILGVNSLMLNIATQQVRSEQKLNAQEYLSFAIRTLETPGECDRSLRGLQVSNQSSTPFKSKSSNVDIVRTDKILNLSTSAKIKAGTVPRVVRIGNLDLYRQVLQIEFRLATRPIQAPTQQSLDTREPAAHIQELASRYSEIPIITTDASGGQIVSCKTEIGPELACMGMGWVWDSSKGCQARPQNVCNYLGTYTVAKQSGRAIRANPGTGGASCPEGSSAAVTGQTSETITYTCMSCS